MIRSRKAALLGLLGLCCAPVAAQDYHLAERLPASTMAYFAVPSASGFRRGINQLGIAKLFLEPEGRKLARGIHAAAMNMLQGLGPERQAVVAEVFELLNCLQGEVAIALIDVDEQRGIPLFAAALDFGSRVERFENVLTKRLREYAERGYEVGSYVLGDRRVSTLALGPVVLHHAFLGRAWIVTNDDARLPALLGNASDQALSNAGDFAAATAHVLPSGAEAMLHLHVSVASLYERFAPMLPGEVSMVIESFELDRLRAFSYAACVEGGAVVERLRVHAPDGLGALGELTDREPTSHHALRFIPANAFLYSSQRIRFEGLASLAQRVAAFVLPNGQAGVDEFLQHFEQRFGFRLETDFVQNFGSEVAYYAAFPEGGGLIPEFALGLEIKDNEKFLAHLNGLLSATTDAEARAWLKPQEYRGHAYHTLEVELPPQAFSFMPLRPCLLLHGRSAIVTLFPHTMKAVIERLDAGGAQPSLQSDPDFAALLERAPAAHQGFSYFRAKGLLGLLYNTAAPLAQSIGQRFLQQNLGADLDLIDLPSAAAVAKHLVDLAAWSMVDDQGMQSTIVSPIGVIPMVVLIVAPAALFATTSTAKPVPHGERIPEAGEEGIEEEWEIDADGNLRRKR